MGPNYKRPQVAVPGQFRGAPTGAADPAASIADTKWQDLFSDQTLNQMVTTALAHNFDLRIAAERVEEARAQLGITRANQYPFVGCPGEFHRSAEFQPGGVPCASRHEPEPRPTPRWARRCPGSWTYGAACAG